MGNKVMKLIVTIAISVMLFMVTGIICALAAGPIIGSTIDTAGNEELNGGSTTTLVIFAICTTVSIVFAVWFYKNVHLAKNNDTYD